MASKQWSGYQAGNWSVDANWTPSGAPTALDDAFIGSAGYDTSITGTGISKSLTTIRQVGAVGTFTTGVLTVGDMTYTKQGNYLGFRSGSKVTATEASITFGELSASDGTSVVISGPVALHGGPILVAEGASSGGIEARLASTVQLGNVTMTPSNFILNGVPFIGGSTFLQLDNTSVIELGSLGNAAKGSITVDGGFSLSGAGTLYIASGGSLVDNGTVTAQGGTLSVTNGPVTGSGTLQIAAGATLYLNYATTTVPVAFLGTGATLKTVVTIYPPANGAGYTTSLTVSGVISGFTSGDTIDIYSNYYPLTAVAYRATSPGLGTLTVSSNGAVIGTYTLAGNYSTATFAVAAKPGAAFTYDITVQPGTTPVVPTPDPLFDANYYLAHNPDVAASGIDPYQHYLAFGWKEGRDPSALFDTRYYLTQNPDVAAAGVNPLLHFEQFGWKEGRQPSLVFDDAKYLAANPDVRAAGADPLQHYMQFGQSEGRLAFLTGGTAAADPLVNAAYYDLQLGATLIPSGAAAAQQAAWSYDATGWQKGLNPSQWFDTNYYLSHNPDVAAAHVDPLLHYETSGWKEGRDPSAAFSTNKYLAANPDVKAAGVDPLLHYVASGQAEGRAIFPA